MTSSRRLLAGFLTALALTAFANPLQSQETAPPLAVPQTQESPASLKKDDPVTLNFPHASVVDILTFYEQLTGKKLIRDSNLQGPELSVSAPGPLSRKDAVSLIESSLLLNGYTLVPVDAATVKILGPSRPPRSEGLPLYVDESQLPADGDKLVSFYKPLRFLSPGEAVQVIDGVIQRNAYGSIAPVPNTSAIVITEKTPVIRKALALLEIVDQAPSQIITEFIPLQRASADKVVETLGQMFGGGGGAVPAAPQGGGGQQQQGGGAAAVSAGGETHLLAGKAQFIADKRTNRILVIVRADNYKYVREVIAKLDQPLESSNPLVRPLNFLPVSDVFPVLVDMLKGKDDATNAAASLQSGQSNSLQRGQTTQNQTTTGSSGSVANSPDKLAETAQQSPPVSASIGSTSIMADPGANNIVVYGPPETKAKAAQILDILDQRPKQVYLACVIGQLRLQEGVDYGASWIAKIQTSGTNPLYVNALNPATNGFGNIINSITNGVNITNPISLIPGALGGLTVYGTIAKGVMTYAQFLETTGRFRVLSRPCVYTSNNKKATIFSGQNVPIPGTSTYNTVGAVGTNSLNNVTSTVQYQPVVLKLEVIPLVNGEKEVNLVIAQHNDKLGTYNNVGGNQVPTIETQELTTTVRVRNGSTIVLGGLITDDKSSDDAGIPYVNRIPIVGPLLGGHTTKKRTRSELVIMIQPVVVDSNSDMEKASAEEGAYTELGRQAQNLKEKLQPTPTPKPKKYWYQKVFQPQKIGNF